ncbi:MAG TPA: ABC transporter permease [Candidatus Limnocylindrales bacterium]|jgi:putative spermidine/putrescine transport system permease protein|nr:ABC transporter permease [Candidatus Limnocylindrales bacterium]
MTAVGRAKRPWLDRIRPRTDGWSVLALPAVVFLGAFFLVPLVAMSVRSVTDPPGAGLANYEQFFGEAAYVRVLLNTFWIALLATVACLVIGYPFAYLMTIVPGRVAGLLLIAVLLPFWSSLLVRTFAWQVILRDTGIINRFLLDLGAISEPLTLIRTTGGVIAGMTHILLPFMVLPLFAVMRRIDPEYGRAAANLGASPISAFLRIFVPLSLPGVLAGCLLVFILALGFYITPALLGGLRDQMISQLIVQQIQQRLDWGFGTAMSVLLVGITLVILFVASRAIRLRDVFGSVVED